MRAKSVAVLLFLVLCLGAALFLNTWQGYRYEKLRRDVQNLEAEQRDWLEQNKKLVAALAVLSSPERIETIAQGELGLKKIAAPLVTTIALPERNLDE